MIDISEIKKLPTEEKLRIIDELLDSIDEAETDQYNADEESPEVIALLEERTAKYERGESKGHSWQEVEKELKKDEEERRKK